MFINLKADKTKTSNIIIVIFLIVLFVSALSSEFFQAPKNQEAELRKYRTLFKPATFKRITSFSLENNLGQFELVHQISNNEDLWNLSYPRKLPGRKDSALKIINTLKDIKIRKVLSKDTINLSNFSLKPPRMSLTLNSLDEVGKSERTIIRIGLTNPIDNSTYLSIDGRSAIYHIDALNSQIESMDIGSFIDASILTTPLKKITSLSIYKGAKKRNRHQLKISKKAHQWFGKNGRSLQLEKVEKVLLRLTSLKSTFIIDNTDKKLKQELIDYFSRPLFTFEIKDSHQNDMTYIISSLVSSLNNLKIEKRKYILIKASNRPHPYLVDKSFLKVFKITENKLRRLSIKKLFY